jgi:hypothetical protein
VNKGNITFKIIAQWQAIHVDSHFSAILQSNMYDVLLWRQFVSSGLLHYAINHFMQHTTVDCNKATELHTGAHMRARARTHTHKLQYLQYATIISFTGIFTNWLFDYFSVNVQVIYHTSPIVCWLLLVASCFSVKSAYGDVFRTEWTAYSDWILDFWSIPQTDIHWQMDATYWENCVDTSVPPHWAAHVCDANLGHARLKDKH